jgi:putative phage-type endonuclease
MEQNTKEWYEFRRNKIGGSDAAIILGISPWKTAYQLFQDKVLGTEEEPNSAMQRGHDMEPFARAEFEKMTGIVVMPKVVINPKLDWQIASLDGISLDGQSIVEIKCASRDVHNMAKDKKIPDYYYSQVQHQLAVTGLNEALYFSYNGKEGALVHVKREQGYIDHLIEKEHEFWERLHNQDPPELSDRDYVDMSADDLWKATANQLKGIMDDIDTYERIKEKLRAQLIALSGQRNAYGSGLKLTKSLTKGAVDYDSIPELTGIDRDKYRKKPFVKWTVRLT